MEICSTSVISEILSGGIHPSYVMFQRPLLNRETVSLKDGRLQWPASEAFDDRIVNCTRMPTIPDNE
jgi:hypothetical protein